MTDIRVVGLDDALRRLQHLQQPELDKASQKVISAAARSLVAPIKAQAPVKTGRLRAAVSARRGKRMGHPSAIVGPRTGRRGAPHRHLVIAGTKPHDIAATKGGFLHFGNIFAAEVRHPGSKPNPFVERAVEGSETRLKQFVQRALVKALGL